MTPEDRDEDLQLADAYLRELRDVRLAYKPEEAARLLGIDTRTVQRLMASGRLRGVRTSSRLTLIPRAALFEFLGLTSDETPADQVAL